MAHHVFRRCLFGEIVPLVPVVYGDYRLMVPQHTVVVYIVDGKLIGDQATDVGTLRTLYVKPIPPGIDTGLGFYRVDFGNPEVYFTPISPGVEIGNPGYKIKFGNPVIYYPALNPGTSVGNPNYRLDVATTLTVTT